MIMFFRFKVGKHERGDAGKQGMEQRQKTKTKKKCVGV